MTPSPKFKVGQPVWVFDTYSVTKEKIGYIDDDRNYYTRLLCGKYYKITGKIIPRPTLLWSIREWFSSLRK